jgi:hypothetical protein
MDTTNPKENYTYLGPEAQNTSLAHDRKSSTARRPCSYRDPRNMREGEHEYNNSVNGHPSTYLPFTGS